MRVIETRKLWLKILAIVIITILMGIAPFPHAVKDAMFRVGQTRGDETEARLAKDLALIAAHLPWRSDLWEAAGHHAYRANDYDLAIAAFQNGAAKGDLSCQGFQAFGEVYLEVGNPYTAEQLWEATITIFGPSEDLLTRIADVQRSMEDPSLITTLKSLLNFQRTNNSPSLQVARTNYELGLLLAIENPGSASPYLLQAVELDPKNTTAGSLAFTIQRALPQENPAYTLMAVGREFANQNNWGLASKAFQKVTLILPDYVEGWVFFAEAIQHLDDETKKNALEPLEKALDLEPDSLSANIFMALYWKRNGDPDQYYQYLAKAAKIDPGNPDILVDLGEAAALMGDLETGYDYLVEANKLTYNDPAYLRAIVSYCIRYNYDLRGIALPTARQAVIRDSSDPATLDTLGQVLFRLGDLLNAQRFYLRALNRDSDYAPAYLHLGLVYNMLDQPEQAANAFTRAIALAPGTITASQAERLINGIALP